MYLIRFCGDFLRGETTFRDNREKRFREKRLSLTFRIVEALKSTMKNFLSKQKRLCLGLFAQAAELVAELVNEQLESAECAHSTSDTVC